MTQNKVAEVLHVSTQAVSNWERGKGYPDIQNILQLSDLFDVSLDE
ncbi:helix-turn-helix transcriptional regulator [Enterococcus camelliae]|uniref:Helix-turn-helix transcriptional regulator n=1 Tax=Enterococcus camelliae TaxID=453959 RepID=A0ABW5TG36_9ENTE